MIRSVLYLTARDDEARAAAVEFFRAERVLERATAEDGCLEATLLRSTGDGPLLVTALWSELAAYGRWVADPWRQSTSVRLGRLLDTPLAADARGELYEVMDHAAR